LNEDLRVNTGNAAEKKDIKLNSVWGLGNMPSLQGSVSLLFCFYCGRGNILFSNLRRQSNYLDTI
jgi:hypothetical protein